MELRTNEISVGRDIDRVGLRRAKGQCRELRHVNVRREQQGSPAIKARGETLDI